MPVRFLQDVFWKFILNMSYLGASKAGKIKIKHASSDADIKVNRERRKLAWQKNWKKSIDIPDAFFFNGRDRFWAPSFRTERILELNTLIIN